MNPIRYICYFFLTAGWPVIKIFPQTFLVSLNMEFKFTQVIPNSGRIDGNLIKEGVFCCVTSL